WDPLEWQCKEGHKWKASSRDILKGTWYPRCSTLGRKSLTPDQKCISVQSHATLMQRHGQPQYNIDIAKNIAQERG
ncbi:7654_t:CDS:1, partial [Acaulospora morrowiae]